VRQNQKGEVVIHSHNHRIIRSTGILHSNTRIGRLVTVCIYRIYHLWKDGDKLLTPTGAYRDIEIIIIGICQRLIVWHPDNDPPRFILDGCNTRLVYIVIGSTAGGAISWVVVAGSGIAHAEGRGVLNNDPRIQQAPKLKDTEDHEQ